jgi:hypothetical protein
MGARWKRFELTAPAQFLLLRRYITLIPPPVLAWPAAATAAPHITAVGTSARPVLDGRLDDSVWLEAPASDAFRQKFPTTRAESTDKTAAVPQWRAGLGDIYSFDRVPTPVAPASSYPTAR